jgi:hypothetical protein
MLRCQGVWSGNLIYQASKMAAARPRTMHPCTEFCGAGSSTLQAKTAHFTDACVDAIMNLVKTVSNNEKSDLLTQQLLCGDTSQLLARVLDGALATLQVPPHTRVATMYRWLLSWYLSPICVATMYRRLLGWYPHSPCVLPQRTANELIW